MVDMTAVFSLVSGLGGAAVGAVAAVYGPALVERRRQRHQVDDRSHDTVANARSAAHTWQRMASRRIQELRAGRPVELAAFDQETEAAMDAVTKAITDLARPEILVGTPPTGAVGLAVSPETDPPILTRMWSIITNLRWIALQQSDGVDPDTSQLTRLEDEAIDTRRAMGALLEEMIRRRTSAQLPAPLAQSKPPD
ncbi:hypothetical protein [Streptomyces niveus]|uniref:hypothetical protein n=1 Tax=Streptomyces niveus TaxID=193462 RepID=UPI003447F37D